VPSDSSSGHGHCTPPSRSIFSQLMPRCMGESVRNSSHMSCAVGLPQSVPSLRASSVMISMSSLAPAGGSIALRTRCTRRSLLVTVPSASHQEAVPGSTTSVASAVSVRKMSCTTRWASWRMSSFGTPVSRSARSSGYRATDSLYASKSTVARLRNSPLTSPALMISLAIAFASEMSLPTWMPSQASAHCAVLDRRGSTVYIRAPLRMPFSTWWKKIGCASRAFEPHMTMRSASSASR
jgi:hypothetical protein